MNLQPCSCSPEATYLTMVFPLRRGLLDGSIQEKTLITGCYSGKSPYSAQVWSPAHAIGLWLGSVMLCVFQLVKQFLRFEHFRCPKSMALVEFWVKLRLHIAIHWLSSICLLRMICLARATLQFPWAEPAAVNRNRCDFLGDTGRVGRWPFTQVDPWGSSTGQRIVGSRPFIILRETISLVQQSRAWTCQMPNL